MLLLLATGGCADRAGCAWVKPLTASKSDTLETKRQILSHDQTWKKLKKH